MVKIRKNLLPESLYYWKSPYEMKPTRIVVHNTANDASADAEIKYMNRSPEQGGVQVSYHYAVDDIEAVQGLPENRNGWHAGDGNGKGNREGIAIEICYSKSGGERFIKAEQNAVDLIVDILNRYGWGMDKITKHQDYMNKYCPHRTLDMGWDRFLKMIEDKLNKNPKPVVNEDTTGVITYKAYDGVWLPEVNKCDDTDNGYAGRYGRSISGIKARCEHGEIFIQSHIIGASNYLPEISSKNYNNNNEDSYSGIYGRPIDCVKIRSTKGWVKYRVHIKGGKWLPWVDSRTKTGSESYAGIYGKEIDGIQMY
jgi:hypothetical protein